MLTDFFDSIIAKTLQSPLTSQVKVSNIDTMVSKTDDFLMSLNLSSTFPKH